MLKRQSRSCQPASPRSLPQLWFVSDARNDAQAERALARLPRGSALVYRHYHLPPAERRVRFDRLARLARARGHLVILAGAPTEVRARRADGAYGPAPRLARGGTGLRLISAHSLREIAMAARARADALLLSPVFPTRSHPGAKALGPLRFRLLARRSAVPVIALGGMTRTRAHHLRWPRWAAIDGLS